VILSTYQTIVGDFNNGILKITLNRPERLNVLNEKMLDELAEVFNQAANESSIKALLITGMGKAFCAGADIGQMAALTARTGFDFAQKGQTVFSLLEKLNKPSIAAINGFAIGGGNELAMAATLRIASTKAVFAQPEVKLGLIPGYGGANV
jgi:enoyl-CoA hydratase